jgi:hypothetical protein
MKSFAWGKWISLFCAVSFVVLGIDSLINHINVLRLKPFTLIPVIFLPIALILCLMAVFSKRFRRFAWIVGLLAIFIELAGTSFHNAKTFAERDEMTYFDALAFAIRPPLAPAAFASTGVLMLFVAFDERKK